MFPWFRWTYETPSLRTDLKTVDANRLRYKINNSIQTNDCVRQKYLGGLFVSGKMLIVKVSDIKTRFTFFVCRRDRKVSPPSFICACPENAWDTKRNFVSISARKNRARAAWTRIKNVDSIRINLEILGSD